MTFKGILAIFCGMKGRGIFVSGTGTEIGKTVVSACLFKILIETGKRICYYKPVQSGAVNINGKMNSPDAMFVKSVLKREDVYCSYLLQKPASPHFAARLEAVNISLDKIASDYYSLQKKYDIIICEGAGGLFVPLNDKGILITQIAEKCSMNILLVADAGLGTINHVSLSCFYAKKLNLYISAIFLIYYDDNPTDIELENLSILKKLNKIESIFLIPAIKGVDTEKKLTGDLDKKLKYFPDKEIIKNMIYD